MKEITKEQAQVINKKIIDTLKAELLKLGFSESEIQDKLSRQADSVCAPVGTGGVCVVGV